MNALCFATHQACCAAGVGTENVVDSYINTLRVLRALDANGALLAAAAPPLRAYLRARPDTIRTVVRFLTQVCR